MTLCLLSWYAALIQQYGIEASLHWSGSGQGGMAMSRLQQASMLRNFHLTHVCKVAFRPEVKQTAPGLGPRTNGVAFALTAAAHGRACQPVMSRRRAHSLHRLAGAFVQARRFCNVRTPIPTGVLSVLPRPPGRPATVRRERALPTPERNSSA